MGVGDSVVWAAAGGGLDIGPWTQLGAVGVVASAFLWYILDDRRDDRKQRDNAIAKLDKINDTLAPLMQRVLTTLQDDRDLLLQFKGALDQRRRDERSDP